MKITPGYGVDELHFGMTKSQVFERLGFPDKSYLTEFKDREVQYFTPMLVLKFESSSEDRLGWIEVHNKDSTIFGVSPWSMQQSDVIELFSNALGGTPEQEDYSSFESFTYADHWVELQFQFGRLACINIGVRYDDNDSPVWPVET